MSHTFVPVQWNRHKRIYDLILIAVITVFLIGFLASGSSSQAADPVILIIRGLGACAFFLLNIALMIGPSARLSDRFKPLLYNRRHLGVMTAILGLAHAGMALMWYHGAGVINPIASAIGGYGNYGRAIEFPFESLGLIALLILLVMAATSHDFWLNRLSPPVWKTLHMGVYIAYVLLVAHVALGTAQFEESKSLIAIVCGAAGLVTALHLASLFKGRAKTARISERGWLNAGSVDAIPPNRAITLRPKTGERIAVFKHDKGISAIEAVCPHQNGPLNEGCIVDGLITCPWHGFQFDPLTGKSPPPFEDEVRTYQTKVENGDIWVMLGDTT